MHRQITGLLFFAIVLVCSTPRAQGYLTCGNGIVDYNETCDTALTACCNISCSGVYDLTTIDFAQPTCFEGNYNYAQLSPLLTMHSGYEFTWMFSQVPGGATPSILTPNEQSTYFTFNSNGLYILSVQIATPSCGTYYTEDFIFIIDDCCGNGVVDNGETCDKAALTNGCCDPTYCSFAVEGTPCDGDIYDQCTHQLTCDGAGQCVSAENRPYTLTALQVQSVVDETCTANVRTFTFQTSIDDPLDSTPGDYYWYVTILGSTNNQHTVVTTAGLVEGPTATVAYSIKTVGGGSISTRLTVIDPCGLVQTIDYNVTRECCGNGVLNTNEACDTNGNPYCSNDCSYIDGWCGDAIVQEHEFCDYKLNSCCSTTCSSYLPSSNLCRMSRGDCDLAEYCPGNGPDCPEDTFKPSSHICRNSLGLCDSPETCSGFDSDCPNQNDPLPAGTLCRASLGVCANDMYCDGLSYGCALTTYKNTTCRPAIGSCDTPERCQQGNPNCPVDFYLAENTTCANASSCFLGGQCMGDGPYCSLELFLDNCTNTSTNSNASNPCAGSSCFFGEGLVCVFGNTTNACTINGQCFPDGATNPSNECQHCDAAVNIFDWSSFDDGTVCTTQTPENACSGIDTCVSGVCVDQYKPSDVICRSNVGSCDEPEYCPGDGDVCPQDLFKNASTTCRFASGACDVQETCTGYSPYCPTDRVFSNTTLCRGVVGPCDVPETCDGVNKACPVDRFKSARVMCRSATGVCDRSEYCTGADAFCPLDEQYGSELVCREAAAPCDAEERCTGHGSACPPDLYANATRICRPSSGACDRPEYCTGNSLFCPFDTVKTHGEVCRVSRGGCDPGEVCTGSSKQCPKDEVSCAGTLCRAATGPCDKEEYCDGESFTCPEDQFRSPRFICRLKQGKCDVEEYCTLGTADCPDDAYLESGEVCRPSKGRCDLEEQCTGISAFCPPDEKAEAGVECRTVNGVCSRPNVCSGVDNFCPENGFASSGEICRDPVGECDQPEYCTGRHPDCPADLRASTNTMCSVPDGPCAKPAFCLANGTCLDDDLFYDSGHLCHTAQSQCDYDAYCTGNSSDCPYFSEDVIDTPCVSSGLTCRNDFCSDVNECSLGDLSSCACSSNAQCEVSDDSCLVGYCANFFCQRTVVPGKCFIDGMCLDAGDHNPYNYCQFCRPSFSPLLWASEEAGTHCDTGADEGDCSKQDTCDANGVCIDNYRVGRVCRESVSNCDLEETCVHGNDWCPEDEVRPDTFVCRASIGDCDLPEQCDGHSPYCPSDVFYPSTHVCRLPTDLCDNAEKCSGESAFCPRDVLKPKGAICRERCGSCDLDEVCNGEDSHCPADRVQSTDWICRAGVGDCDRPETCDGESKYCPDDELFTNGTVCRHQVDTCDEEEVCDGVSVDCPDDLFAANTKICRISVSTCDIPDFCTGYTNSCPSDEVRAEGFICRPPLAACDHPEECDGQSNVCPEDTYYPNTHVCRPASSKCDIEDKCTGLDIQCPYDARRPDGYPCADDAFCNGDELCFGGVCQPSAGIRNCSRPRPCRLDSCDESTEICVHATHDNIGQICYTGPDGTLDIGICRAGTWSCNDNGDLVCVGQRLPKDFDFCGNDKDDDCNGLVDDGCWTGPCTNDTQCINSPIDTCHTGHCNTSTSKCVYTLDDNTCFIDDHCQGTNDYKIHNPCLRCFPNISTSKWIQQNQANVSNGNICDGFEKCQNGKVVIETKPLHCHRLNGPCQRGVCDPSSGCYLELLPNGTQCERPGHECSVAFTCAGGQCVCDGIEQVGTTEAHTITIVGAVFGSLIFVAVVVFIMLDVRYNPEKIKAY